MPWSAAAGPGTPSWPAPVERINDFTLLALTRKTVASLSGVGVGGREMAALEERGDGLGVLAVALGLAAVHGFHGPGVAENEGDVLVAAGVRQPVPAVHALAGDDEPVAEGCDGTEEGAGSGGKVAGDA